MVRIRVNFVVLLCKRADLNYLSVNPRHPLYFYVNALTTINLFVNPRIMRSAIAFRCTFM
jgi:hypothetical protein